MLMISLFLLIILTKSTYFPKNSVLNATQYNSTDAHSYKVVMYIQKLHHFCNTSPP